MSKAFDPVERKWFWTFWYSLQCNHNDPVACKIAHPRLLHNGVSLNACVLLFIVNKASESIYMDAACSNLLKNLLRKKVIGEPDPLNRFFVSLLSFRRQPGFMVSLKTSGKKGQMRCCDLVCVNQSLTNYCWRREPLDARSSPATDAPPTSLELGDRWPPSLKH